MGGGGSIEYFLGLDTGNGMTALVHRSVIKNWANQSSRYEKVTTIKGPRDKGRSRIRDPVRGTSVTPRT